MPTVKSSKTTATVTKDGDEGQITIVVERDGRTIHRFNTTKEPAEAE